ILASEDWLTLSAIMKRINLSNIKNKRTRYRVFFIKGIIDSYLQTLNGHGTINASLLMGALKTLASLEKELGEQNPQFIFFMRSLVLKFERQSLLANKVLEKRLEFKKMKEVIEL
ncbi:MAG: hypothetical protein QXZ30_01150, partial [Candidatus Bilamarchaeaceae archaeon]